MSDDPALVVRAILAVIERRRHEVTAPARDPGLVTARLLRWLHPILLWKRFDPLSRWRRTAPARLVPGVSSRRRGIAA